MSSASALIGNWLGVERPATASAVLGIVENQLEPRVIERLLELGLTREEVDAGRAKND
jgi:hypothetical protein